MAELLWYFTRGGQQAGPVEEDALREMIASGQLSPQELVWREGMPNWQPAAATPELLPGSGITGHAAPNPFAAQRIAQAPPGVYPTPGNPAAGQPVGYVEPLQYGQAARSFYSNAMTAFVLSLVGLFCVGIILGPVAIVLGSIAQGNMKRTGNFQGKGLAVAAIVIGILDLVRAGLFFGLRMRLFRHF